jgi:hypothetical protein
LSLTNTKTARKPSFGATWLVRGMYVRRPEIK